tara:strand:+ start:4993 stop:5475 length:483 start_codon:yes stop_codon:yes gene_type:complete
MKKTKKPNKNHCCGHCSLAEDIKAGKVRYKITFGHCEGQSCAHDPNWGPMEKRGGAKRWATTEEAIEHLARLCANAKGHTNPKDRVVVPEIRREGQRILKAGTNVTVQLKRKSGTKRDDGFVIECYDDNYVKLYVGSLNEQVTVLADEFVKARRGTTRVL